MENSNKYVVVTRVNTAQKKQLEEIRKNLGISMSATVKLLTTIGMKNFESIHEI